MVNVGEGESIGKSEWQLTFVDFGMVGRISVKAKEGMRDLLSGVVTRDVYRVMSSYQKRGFLLPGADLELLKKAENELFDRFWGKSMSELQHTEMGEMVEFAYRFRDLLYDLPFQIPQDLIFLGRAVGILSGMSTGLSEDFNVWDALAPYAKKLLADEGTGTVDKVLEEVGKYARRLLSLPSRAEAVLVKLEKGELITRDPKLAQQIQRLEGAVKQAAWSIVFMALLLGAVLSFLDEQLVLAACLGFGAGLAFLGVIWRRT